MVPRGIRPKDGSIGDDRVVGWAGRVRTAGSVIRGLIEKQQPKALTLSATARDR